jgi:hypothetical protein
VCGIDIRFKFGLVTVQIITAVLVRVCMSVWNLQ